LRGDYGLTPFRLNIIDWGRCRLSAGGASSASEDQQASELVHLPFWFKPISVFGLSLITTFINGSRRFTLPAILAPDHLDARSHTFFSRFGCHPFRMVTVDGAVPRPTAASEPCMRLSTSHGASVPEPLSKASLKWIAPP